MTDEQIIKLAKHLRNLASRLAEKDTDWTEWVEGNLLGTAEILESQVKEEK